MVTLGDRRYGNPVIVHSDGSITKPRRIPFTKKAFEEGWIQELIRANPEILPVDEIEPAFAPLLCVGREVPTDAGSIDNLYLSPQGYLTIVETKLWRNPEARREVVVQIIDYAKDISSWSFDKLEDQVRTYNQQYRDSKFGIIDTLRLIEQIDETEEPAIVDTISRNIQRGRFLLLIVGDGIRESVEAMVNFLAQTPQLYFTLALAELQVYELDEDKDKSLLVIPQIVTRTREITRAIVRIEGKAEGIIVDIPREDEERSRKTITKDAFFNILSQNVGSELEKFARQIKDDMGNRGCDIDWKGASYVVKLHDPGESGQNLTLFVVTKEGKLYPGWLTRQLRDLGLPEQIAIDFVKNSAQLFKRCEVHHKKPSKWSRHVTLEELQQRYDDFVSLVQKTIDRIKDASDKME